MLKVLRFMITLFTGETFFLPQLRNCVEGKEQKKSSYGNVRMGAAFCESSRMLLFTLPKVSESYGVLCQIRI